MNKMVMLMAIAMLPMIASGAEARFGVDIVINPNITVNQTINNGTVFDESNYILVNGTRDFSGNQSTLSLIPTITNAFSLGNITNRYDTVFLNNPGGIGIDFKTAVGTGADTNYIFDMGGGAKPGVISEGGTFTFRFDDIGAVTNAVNRVIFDLGNADAFAAAGAALNCFEMTSKDVIDGTRLKACFGGFNDGSVGFNLSKDFGANTRDFFIENHAGGKITIGRSTQPIIDIRTNNFVDFPVGDVIIGSTIIDGWSFAPFTLDIFDFKAETNNFDLALRALPKGSGDLTEFIFYNAAGGTGQISFGVDNAIAFITTAQTSTPIESLLIGEQDTDGALNNITFLFGNTPEYFMTPTLLNFTDNNIETYGNFTGNQFYGEMWNYSAGGVGWQFDIDTSDTYYNMTSLAVGELNGFNHTEAAGSDGGSYLTAMVKGLYKMSMSISFNSEANGGLYGMAVVENFEVDNHRDCYARREATSSVGNVGITCLMHLEVGGIVNIQVENENTNRDMYIHTVNLNLMRVGD